MIMLDDCDHEDIQTIFDRVMALGIILLMYTLVHVHSSFKQDNKDLI